MKSGVEWKRRERRGVGRKGREDRGEWRERVSPSLPYVTDTTLVITGRYMTYA